MKSSVVLDSTGAAIEAGDRVRLQKAGYHLNCTVTGFAHASGAWLLVTLRATYGAMRAPYSVRAEEAEPGIFRCPHLLKLDEEAA